MKKVASTLCIGLAGLVIGSTAYAIPPSKPFPGVINAQQLEKVVAGQTKEEVIALLGTPQSQTKWVSGTTSLSYHLEGKKVSGNTIVLIEIDTKTGKVLQRFVEDKTVLNN